MFICSQSPQNIIFRADGKSVLVRGTAGFFGATYTANSGVAYTEATPEAIAICQADPNWLMSRCSVTSRLPEGMTAIKTEVIDHAETKAPKAKQGAK